MKIDNEKAQKTIDCLCDLEDGLTMFVGQGKKMIDMCVYRGNDFNIFEITIFPRNPERADEDTFFNYNTIKNMTTSEEFLFDEAVCEYYDNEREAHARIMTLIAEHNYF